MEIKKTQLNQIPPSVTPPPAKKAEPETPVLLPKDTVVKSKAVKSQAVKTEIPQKDWTILFYMNGNNHLSRIAISTLKQLESVGNSDQMNMVAQVSRPKAFIDKVNKDWSGARRYNITDSGEELTPWQQLKQIFSALIPFTSITKGIHSELKADLGKIDMGSAESLKDFVNWGMKEYPAKHTMVVMLGPSKGVSGMMQDDTTKNYMKIPELASALKQVEKESGKKVDVLALDGSAGASMEIAYELKGAVDYLVAPQGVQSGTGSPLPSIANEWKSALQTQDRDPKTMARYYVLINSMVNTGSVFAPTVAGIDLKKIESVKKHWETFSQALFNSNLSKSQLRKLIAKAQEFQHTPDRKDWQQSRDAVDFAQQIINDPSIKDDQLKAVAKDAIKAIKASLIGDAHTGVYDKNANGMSVFIPLNYGFFRPDGNFSKSDSHDYDYKDLKFSQKTSWDEVLQKTTQDNWLNRAFKKLGVSETVIDKVTEFKRKHEGKVATAAGYGSWAGWINAINAWFKKEPAGFFFLSPMQAVTAGVFGGLYDTWQSIKGIGNAAFHLKDKDQVVYSSMNAVRDLGKAVANASYLAPALLPIAPTAGMLMFVMPWVKDFYGIWDQFRQIKNNIDLSTLPPQDRLNVALIRHFGQKIQWD